MFDDLFPPPQRPEEAPAAPVPAEPAGSPALEKFRSCRWRAQVNGQMSDYCTHRDVLPLAGTTGFVAESWCPDCPYYKLRRTPRKRESY